MPSSLRWIGAALPVADLYTLVIGGTWAASDTLSLTVGSRTITLTVGTTVTTTSIAASVQQMWSGDANTGDGTFSETGDNVPEFTEAKAAVVSSTVTLTGNTVGAPVAISRSLSSTSGTATLTHTRTATGPEFWDNTANWDGGTVPVTGDTVYLDSLSTSVKYGLAQSAVTLAALYIAQSFTGDIGLSEVNDGGGYEEYRAQYLAIGATILQIGAGAGAGSGRIKINTGSVQTALTVFNTGTSTDANLPAVIWKGTHASNALVQVAGLVGVGEYGGEVATIATVKKEDGDLYTGPGVTLSGALVQNGGSWNINSAIATSLTQLGGQTTINGTGAVAQLTVRSGVCVYNTTGTLGGATVVSGGGQIDFGQDPRAKTVTNPIDAFSLDPVSDPHKVVSSLIIDYNGLEPIAGLGPDVRITRAATA